MSGRLWEDRAVSTHSAAAPAAAPEQTHRCVRCGAAIPLADALCESCNPAGLVQPASSQAHGTVFGGIVVAIVALAAVATYLLGGVGPFRATVESARPDGDGLVLVLGVSNQGQRAGHASCRVWDPAYLANPPLETWVRTPEIAAGATVVFDQRVGALGRTLRPLAIDCTR